MAWSKLNPCALVSHVLFKVRLPSAPATRSALLALPRPLGRPRPPLPLCQAIASTPVLSYSVYTLTDATEISIGFVVVVVVLQTGALLTYLFCEFFSDNFVVNFVVLSLFLACDFWTVSDSNLQPLSLFLSLRSKSSDDFC